jgi:uncharacterized protein (DUF1501 family)
MKRRNLLKMSAVLGASAALPWLSRPTAAQSNGYAGPYWIFITASGGWDPRFLFDPTLEVEQNRLYTEIGKVGNISFAPIDATPDEFGLELVEGDALPYLNPERFLNKFGNRLTVLNGVDTSTNNHDAGQMAFTSGSLQDGLPALGALLAGTYGIAEPLPFISFGGYDKTYDVAPLSRIQSTGILRDLAAPNILNPNDEDPRYFHRSDVYKRIRDAQGERLEELLATQRLPKLSQAMLGLKEARVTDQELAALQVPTLIDLPGNLGGAENLVRSGQLALESFRAGLSVACNLSIGGFDTHGNHDTDQRRSLIQLLTGFGGLLDEIERLGLTDKVYVVVGSDFGRTPHYNGDGAGSGKDHWPVTSTLVVGPKVEGNRVIGATNSKQEGLSLDPSSLEAGTAGTKLTPTQIQAALRKLAGIDPELEKTFPLLAEEPLPLFA